jgi:hypothetical protein
MQSIRLARVHNGEIPFDGARYARKHRLSFRYIHDDIYELYFFEFISTFLGGGGVLVPGKARRS